MASDGQQTTIGAISDSAREFLTGHATLQRLRRMRGAAGWERDTWQLIARQGWLGIALPESRGGLGLGWAEVCAVADGVVVGSALVRLVAEQAPAGPAALAAAVEKFVAELAAAT